MLMDGYWSQYYQLIAGQSERETTAEEVKGPSLFIAKVIQDSKLLSSIPEAISGQIIKAGLLVAIIEQQNSYLKVVTEDGVTGWVEAIDLEEAFTLEDVWNQRTAPIKLALVNAEKFVLRVTPDKKGKIELTVPQGDTLPLIDVAGDYVKVVIEDGSELWGQANKVDLIEQVKIKELPSPISPNITTGFGVINGNHSIFDTPLGKKKNSVASLDTVTILEQVPYWIKVQKGEIDGWISSFWISPFEKVVVAEETTPVIEEVKHKKEKTTKPVKSKPRKEVKTTKSEVDFIKIGTYVGGTLTATQLILAIMQHMEGNKLVTDYNAARTTEDAERIRDDIRASESSRDNLILTSVCTAALTVGIWNAERLGIIKPKQVALNYSQNTWQTYLEC